MFKKLNDKINLSFEKLFFNTENSTNSTFEEIKKNFELNYDNLPIQNLSYIFSSQVNYEKTKLLFSQLSSFFEVGLLLKRAQNQNSMYEIDEIFAFSQIATQIKNQDLIRLPQTSTQSILKTSARSILKKYHLEFFDEDNDLSAFLIHLNKDNSLILMSSLAEPWLQLRIETLKNSLMKIDFE